MQTIPFFLSSYVGAQPPVSVAELIFPWKLPGDGLARQLRGPPRQVCEALVPHLRVDPLKYRQPKVHGLRAERSPERLPASTWICPGYLLSVLKRKKVSKGLRWLAPITPSRPLSLIGITH